MDKQTEATLQMLKVQRINALIDNNSAIPPFSGDSTSVTCNEFLDTLNNLASLYEWDSEEKKFALLNRVSGGAKTFLKLHKSKTFEQIVQLLKNRYVQQESPEVALAKFMNFRQTNGMCVQDFFDKAADMSFRALLVEGIDHEVSEKSRKALLHSMLLSNLAPEIRKGVVARNPKTPDEILELALLEEKGIRSVNPFNAMMYNNMPSPFEQAAISTSQLACAATFQPKVAENTQNKQIQDLQEQIQLLSTKFESFLMNKDTRENTRDTGDSRRAAGGPRRKNTACFTCGRTGHFSRNCRLRNEQSSRHSGNYRDENAYQRNSYNRNETYQQREEPRNRQNYAPRRDYYDVRDSYDYNARPQGGNNTAQGAASHNEVPRTRGHLNE